ncbi:MAG: hypothetical protein SLAVMIC_00586 [uncultured marine phage]|uniref:Uncharacterized protein n=1 Tax=uncultured marine phage TaxID=707152 RepID=A0A8D9FS97_9VIRU|nr:MAG: hypothetical protein SLAVMIC_00586 [uncultured marine phage]
MIKKYQDFYSQVFESGLRDISKIVKNYPSKECEIYFHQDLDGVTSALAMKAYLDTKYGIKTAEAHIIQYGGMEFAIKSTKEGRMPVLVDFAHGKPMFTIQTDHHQGQAGAEHTQSTHFKHARSNVETISGEISTNAIFTATDIKLINTVDSADFLRNDLKPSDISNSIFNISSEKSGSENRFMMGLVTNRLLLAYKNKKITGTSLDGKRKYVDRNFLECLTLDSTASLISMYTNIKHYVNNFTTKPTRVSPDGKLATPETLQDNLGAYQDRMKDYKDLEVDDEYGIAVQYGGGKMFDPGSYDRYTVFKNNPEINFYSIAWPMGLVQVAANPFKEAELDVDLGGIKDELLDKYQPILSKVWIDILSVKKVAEQDVTKMAEKGEDISQNIGFKATDLEAFYNDKMYHVVDKKIVQYTLTDDVKAIMNKPVSELNYNESQELRKYKIAWYDLINENSGGHKSITNISSWNYFPYAHPKLKDYVAKYFKIEKKPGRQGKMSYKYTDIMRQVQKDFLAILKDKINEAKGVEKTATATVERNIQVEYTSFMKLNENQEVVADMWNNSDREDRVKMLSEAIPSMSDKYADLEWNDLTPFIQEEVTEKVMVQSEDEVTENTVNEEMDVDGMEIKTGDKLLVQNGDEKVEVEVVGSCEKTSENGADCKIKIKVNGKEAYAFHNKDNGDWTIKS